MLLNSKKKDVKIFILFWILVAPLASSLSKEAPNGLRSLLLLPSLILLVALSIEKLTGYSKKITLFLVFIYLTFFVNYVISYYFVYPISSNSWGYGYKQMYVKVFAIEKDYEQIIITGDYWKPRIYYQYYKKSLPEKIDKTNGFEKVGKYYFASTSWDGGQILELGQIEKNLSSKSLIVLSEKEYERFRQSPNLIKIDEIRDYSGRKQVFTIAEVNPKNKEKD